MLTFEPLYDPLMTFYNIAYVFIMVSITLNDNDMLSYLLATMMCFLTKE